MSFPDGFFSAELLKECLPIMLVLNGFGAIIKKINKIPNWLIPILLFIISPVIAWVYTIAGGSWEWTWPYIQDVIVCGVVGACMAVFGHQAVTQIANINDKNKNEPLTVETAREVAIDTFNNYLSQIKLNDGEEALDNWVKEISSENGQEDIIE